MTPLEQAVIDAARVYHQFGPDALPDLKDAVRALDAAETEPQPFRRPWSQIPAGWLVEHPKQPGVWLTVQATRLVQGRQRVRLEFPDGRLGTFPYPPGAQVICKPGGASETDTALATLGEGAYILEDEL